jgi:Capsule assembly protein Wzi
VLPISLPVAADPWLSPGELSLRHDIELLADAEVIRSPVTTWPMSWPDIAREVLRYDSSATLDPHIAAPLARVQYAARKAQSAGFSGWTTTLSAAEKPIELRTFSDTPREDGELGAAAAWMGDRWTLKLSATAVTKSDDDQTFRLDGSFLGVSVGNFMISLGSMDRWWGPGWEGSLILSTNARPIPALGIERNYSDRFDFRLLRWLGPWRASVWLGHLDGDDVAVPDARFLAARLNFRPLGWLELGLSRTAQWCGEGRPCGLDTFTDLALGKDNLRGTGSEGREPGNQMAGYDLRLRSPWKKLPAAFYAQLIGEDEAGGLPSRFLGQFGLETWSELPLGSVRVHVEHAETSCNFSRSDPLFNCAYTNDLYPQGYTYRGRTIGHAMGGDGRMTAIGALLVRPQGGTWSVLGRKIELDRDALEGSDSTVPASRTLKNVELQYNHPFARGSLFLGLGLDDFESPIHTQSELRAFVRWQQGF